MARRRRRVRKNSPIAESIIHTWVGEVQFNRGLNYVAQGLLYRQHRTGNIISAMCEGKNRGPHHYQIKAVIAEGKIEEVHCTCSIGKHGVCPHIAAMLIQFSRTPDVFIEITLWRWLKQLVGLAK